MRDLGGLSLLMQPGIRQHVCLFTLGRIVPNSDAGTYIRYALTRLHGSVHACGPGCGDGVTAQPCSQSVGGSLAERKETFQTFYIGRLKNII